MNSEELHRLIRRAESKIESNIKKVKQLEKDYEDLLSLKRGLNNVFARHEEVCAKNKAAMDNSIFDTNRCMQRFRNSFVSMLQGSDTSGSGGNTSVIDTISERARTVLKDIEEIERETQNLRYQVNLYMRELQALSTTQGVQEG